MPPVHFTMPLITAFPDKAPLSTVKEPLGLIVNGPLTTSV